jgi:tight adherence protein B
MVSVSVLALALATLSWPAASSVSRLRATGLRGGGQGRRLRWRTGLPWPLAGGLAGWLLAGPGTGVAAAILVATVRGRLRDRHRDAVVLRGVADLAEALRGLVGELRSGAHPAVAAEHAGEDAGPVIATVLGTVATTARLGGDVTVALGDLARTQPALAGVLGQLSRAWQLAGRHGLPLADVLDAMRRDLDQRVRFARQVSARMAGPRASAAVLAGLPVLGLLLGQAIGAAPLHVLLHTTLGQFLLVLGVLLTCAGLLWSARLVGKAVTP